MKYKSFTGTNLPCAWIVNPKDRGRKSIKNGKVYLKNGQEFEIEIYNPIQESVLAVIKINGILASENGLIIRPGQRFYLDCFISDKKKFTFNTYEVENSPESKKAIERNGMVEISFYQERKNPTWNYFQPNSWTLWYGGDYTTGTPWYGTDASRNDIPVSFNTSNSGSSSGSSFTISGNTIHDSLKSDTANIYSVNTCSIETGRIEGGDNSNQKFVSMNMDFESYPVSQVLYQILPESMKPLETNDIKKKFCTECGRKTKDSFKFCPDCGIKI